MGKVQVRKVAAKPAAAKKGAASKKAEPVNKEKAVPADVSAKVEALCKQTAKAKKAQAAADVENVKLNEMRDDMLALFGKKKLDGMRHRLGTIVVTKTEFVDVEDFEAVKKAAKRKGNEDLLKPVVNAEAVKARWEAGKEVPGVRKGERSGLRVTLAKKS